MSSLESVVKRVLGEARLPREDTTEELKGSNKTIEVLRRSELATQRTTFRPISLWVWCSIVV